MATPTTEERRIAQLTDPFDPDRSDLDVYAAMVHEFGATRILDVGCGTGTLACLLAEQGIDVLAVDPDAAALEVARAKPGAERVRWVEGIASDLPPAQVDLAFMTANVAQVFLTDDEWSHTLEAVRDRLAPGGRLVFETRIPALRAWEKWCHDYSWESRDVPGVGEVETWCDILRVDEPLVTFRWTNAFVSDGAVMRVDTTLRFRERDELEASLARAGFVVDEIRDAPDRPGREWVFVARIAPLHDPLLDPHTV